MFEDITNEKVLVIADSGPVRTGKGKDLLPPAYLRTPGITSWADFAKTPITSLGAARVVVLAPPFRGPEDKRDTGPSAPSQSIVVLVPVQDSKGRVSSEPGAPTLDRFGAWDQINNLSRNGVSVCKVKGDPEKVHDEFDDRDAIWRDGLSHFVGSTPLEIDIKARAEGRLNVLATPKQGSRNAGFIVVGKWKEVKFAVVPTRFWATDYDPWNPRSPELPVTAFPLLDPLLANRLREAAAAFHALSWESIEPKPCGCHRRCLSPQATGWGIHLDESSPRRRTHWLVTVPGLGPKPVSIAWQPGAVFEALLEKMGTPVAKRALLKCLSIQTGRVPKTPLKKIVSLLRKSLTEDGYVCGEWLARYGCTDPWCEARAHAGSWRRPTPPSRHGDVHCSGGHRRNRPRPCGCRVLEG